MIDDALMWGRLLKWQLRLALDLRLEGALEDELWGRLGDLLWTSDISGAQMAQLKSEISDHPPFWLVHRLAKQLDLALIDLYDNLYHEVADAVEGGPQGRLEERLMVQLDDDLDREPENDLFDQLRLMKGTWKKYEGKP